MTFGIGRAGLEAKRIAERKAHPILAMLAAGGRADWLRMAAFLGGPGERLDEVVRNRMEGLLGRDLGEVTVHSDSAAGQMAGWLRAEAFTIGSRIFAPTGSINPATPRGAGLIAHELVHVVQQTKPQQLAGGPVRRFREPPGSPVPQLAASGASGMHTEQGTEAEARAVEHVARRTADTSQSNSHPVDVEVLAGRVYDLLRQDLILERERRGP